MKVIALTKGKFASVSDEDFERINKHKWYARYSTKTKSFYAIREVVICGRKRKTVRMHREVLNVDDFNIKVDHKNHDTLNNCRENLRMVTVLENNLNTRKRITNKSGYKGVCWDGKRNYWRVTIALNGKQIHIGYFVDIEEANRKACEARLKYHGEFACHG